jgi:hypothetical protein
VKTAKVCALVRVLWLHSAAWIALLVLTAAENQSWLIGTLTTDDDDVREHDGTDGYLPLVFDVAGSRVARTHVQVARKVKSFNIMGNRFR